MSSVRVPSCRQALSPKRHETGTSLRRESVDTATDALEPTVVIVEQYLGGIGHVAGRAHGLGGHRTMACQKLGAAQRLLAIGRHQRRAYGAAAAVGIADAAAMLAE